MFTITAVKIVSLPVPLISEGECVRFKGKDWRVNIITSRLGFKSIPPVWQTSTAGGMRWFINNRICVVSYTTENCHLLINQNCHSSYPFLSLYCFLVHPNQGVVAIFNHTYMDMSNSGATWYSTTWLTERVIVLGPLPKDLCHPFYIQKVIIHLVVLFWFPAGSRRAARGVRICATSLLRN